MPTRVSYDSSRLIPAPLVQFAKSYETAGDGTKLGSKFTITINGIICADKGSPNSSGTFHTSGGYPADEVITEDSRLGAIFRKQEAIRELFSQDGLSLEFQSADGSPPIKCNPRVIDIEFEEDIWFHRCDYTITLEADLMYVNGTALGEDEFANYISSAGESWSISSTDDRLGDSRYPPTYQITHTVNATGKRFFDGTGLVKPAWQQARDWVINRLGFDETIALSSGINNLPEYYNGYNHVRSEEIDELAGTFSVTEAWVLSSGNAVEDFSISITTSNQQANNQVSINGNITGYAERDANFNITTHAMDNAEIKWSGVQTDLLSRAQIYSGYNLNPIVLSTTVGKNPVTGTINYTYQYDDRPSNNITGAVSEVINIDDSYDVNVFGVVPILGRTKGPILQDIGTKRERTRSLNMEIVFDTTVAGSGTVASRFRDNHPRVRSPQSGQIDDIISAVTPYYSSKLFVANRNERWDGVSRYSYNITWVYE